MEVRRGPGHLPRPRRSIVIEESGHWLGLLSSERASVPLSAGWPVLLPPWWSESRRNRSGGGRSTPPARFARNALIILLEEPLLEATVADSGLRDCTGCGAMDNGLKGDRGFFKPDLDELFPGGRSLSCILPARTVP